MGNVMILRQNQRTGKGKAVGIIPMGRPRLLLGRRSYWSQLHYRIRQTATWSVHAAGFPELFSVRAVEGSKGAGLPKELCAQVRGLLRLRAQLRHCLARGISCWYDGSVKKASKPPHESQPHHSRECRRKVASRSGRGWGRVWRCWSLY